MIAETGHYALILALGVAIVQTVLPLVLSENSIRRRFAL
jgi:cytochrome c biogenesis factor